MNIKIAPIVRRLTSAQGGGYLADYPDYPGCCAHGDTAEEALKKGNAALEAWHATHQGLVIGPCKVKWVHRPPKSLYDDLRAGAKEEGVSINAFANYLLTAALTERRVRQVSSIESIQVTTPDNPPG